MTKLLLTLSFFVFSFNYSEDWKTISLDDKEAVFYKYNTDDTAWFKTVSEKQNIIRRTPKSLKLLTDTR